MDDLIKPLLEAIRVYLSERFRVEVTEPLAAGNYYVFTMSFHGVPSEIQAHRDYLTTPDALKHLKGLNLESIFESNNAILLPYRPMD